MSWFYVFFCAVFMYLGADQLVDAGVARSLVTGITFFLWSLIFGIMAARTEAK